MADDNRFCDIHITLLALITVNAIVWILVGGLK